MTSILRPDKFPEWASVDQNDPIKPRPNVAEPPEAKKQAGWFWKEPPPANWMNWLMRYIYRWVKYFDDQTTCNTPVFAVDTGAVNQIVIAPVPAVTSLLDGKLFIVKVKNTITGATTLQVGSSPPKAVIDLDEDAMVGGEILANGMYIFIYSATADKFFLQAKPDVATGFLTGDMKPSSRKDPQAGFIVYAGDSTIGSAISGATFANANTEKLFKYWYDNYVDAICPVDGGRGGMTSDQAWTANKRLHVFPFYNTVIAASGVNGTPGTKEGERLHSITEDETKGHSHSGPKETDGGANGSNPSNFVKHWLESPPQHTGSYGGSHGMSLVQPTTYVNFYVKL